MKTSAGSGLNAMACATLSLVKELSTKSKSVGKSWGVCVLGISIDLGPVHEDNATYDVGPAFLYSINRKVQTFLPL